MTDVVDTRAEIIKLARAMELDPKQLEFLEPIGWRELRQFRLMVVDQIFQAAEQRFKLLAQASKLVPVPITAALAPKYFEPKVCAAMAGLIEEDKALKLVGKLPPEFLADAAVYIDPRKVGSMVSKVSTEVAVKVMPILEQREEYITIGAFVDFVTPELLDAVLPVVNDVTLLRAAEVAENKQMFNVLIPLVDDARMARIMHTADAEGLWPVALDLLNEVNDEIRGRLANLAAQQDDRLLNSLIDAANAQGMFDLLLPVTQRMTSDNLVRFAQLKALQIQSVMQNIVETAIRSDLWAALLPLIPRMPRESIKTMANLPTFQDRVVVASLVDSAVRAQSALLASGESLLGDMLPLLSEVPKSVQAVFAEIIGRLPDNVLDEAVRGVVAAGLWSELLPLVPLLPKEAQRHVSQVAAGFDSQELKSAMVSASDNGHLPEMMTVAAGMPLEQRANAVEIIADGSADEDMLGVTLEPAQQQEVLAGLLKVAEGVPAEALNRLAEATAAFDLEGVVPGIMAAARDTGRWAEGFMILSTLHRKADAEGLDLPVTVQGELLGKVVDQAMKTDLPEPLWFVKPFAEGVGVSSGAQTARALEDTAIAASSLVLAPGRGLVEIQMGRIQEGQSWVREISGDAMKVLPGAKLAADVAGKAGDFLGALKDRVTSKE